MQYLYYPGKWQRSKGPNAYSRNSTLPAPKLPEGNAICCILTDQPTEKEIT